MIIKKSRSKNRIKRYQSKKIKIIKGGSLNIPPQDEIINEVFAQFVDKHRRADFIIYNNCPTIIKQNRNINIISNPNDGYGGLDDILDNIENIENVCPEIINHPNSDSERIFFLQTNNLGELPYIDFTLLLKNSNNHFISDKHKCLWDINFPIISFFYSEVLKLSYWQQIYTNLKLEGRTLNIYNFHSAVGNTEEKIKIINRFTKQNSINIMISCNNCGSDILPTIVKLIKSRNAIFIGFQDFITVWGSNLLCRKRKSRQPSFVSIIESKGCNNLIDNLNSTIEYFDYDIRSRYTQDIIQQNIREMLLVPSKTIQFVNEGNCSKENIQDRIDPFICPDEIIYEKKTPGNEIYKLRTTPENTKEMEFRHHVISDIQRRITNKLDESLLHIKPFILDIIKLDIDKINSNYTKSFEEIKKLSEKELEDEDDISKFIICINHIFYGSSNKAIIDVFKRNNVRITNILNYLYEFGKNYYKIGITKLIISPDIITISINKDLPFSNNTIQFNTETGNIIGRISFNEKVIENIDMFIKEIIKFDEEQPSDSFEEEFVVHDDDF
jgi:hypothetical protein